MYLTYLTSNLQANSQCKLFHHNFFFLFWRVCVCVYSEIRHPFTINHWQNTELVREDSYAKFPLLLFCTEGASACYFQHRMSLCDMSRRRRPVRLCVRDCVSVHTDQIRCNNKEFLVAVSASYLLCEPVCAERFSDSAWQESSACVDSRPSGATATRFDLDSHCRLFCVLGLAERQALDTPWTSRGTHFCALPPLKDQVSLFKAEGALCNPTAQAYSLCPFPFQSSSTVALLCRARCNVICEVVAVGLQRAPSRSSHCSSKECYCGLR